MKKRSGSRKATTPQVPRSDRMNSRVVWITGANGLIGSYLVAQAPQDWNVHPITRETLDLLDCEKVRETYKRDNPALVIHCAAISKSVLCQQHPELAWRTNVEVTRVLSDLAADRAFIFFSSDLVFDGAKGNYREDDSTNPLTRYGETKLEAEGIVRQNPAHTILRTSLNAGVSRAGDRAFNEENRRAWESGKTLNLFTDEFRCPIPAVVTAKVVWTLAKQPPGGLFHLAGTERLSRWQIGQLLAARWPHLEPRMKPSSLRDYQGPPRSPDTSLNCEKLRALLPFRLPRFSDWLAANPKEPI